MSAAPGSLTSGWEHHSNDSATKPSPQHLQIMLFVALTRSSILELLPADSSQQFSIAPGWLMTCATDNFLSRLSVSPNEIVLAESLGCSEDRERDVTFIAAHFQRNRQTLRVARYPVSGRPAYHSVNARGEFFLCTHIAWLRQAGVPIEEDAAVLPAPTGWWLPHERSFVASGDCSCRAASPYKSRAKA